MAKGKSVVIGPTPLEQPLEYRVSRVDGFTYTRTWIGPFFAVERIRLIEQRFAESMELRARGATYTLTGRYASATPGQAEIPTETQELDTEIVQRSIFLNPTFQALTMKDQRSIRNAFNKGDLSRDDVIAAFNGSVPRDGVATVTNLTLATQAFDAMAMGTESYEDFAFVLNRTRTASRRYSGKIKLTNIGKICTTVNLVKYTGNGLLFDAPDTTCTADETAKGLIAGWRLRVCRVSDTAAGSRQMIEQWLLGRHLSTLYSTYVP